MSVLAGCWDLRNMVGIHEIDCPRCGKKEGIEVFDRDNLTISDSVCSGCGYTVQTDVAMWMRDELVEAVAIQPGGYMGEE